MTREERKFTIAKKTLERWKKYLQGEDNYQQGSNLPTHSILAQIQGMVDKDFIFRAFNDAVKKMSDRKDFKEYFSSNEYLINIMKDWYFSSQCLYISCLTDTKSDSCSLMALLKKIQASKCNISRDLFCKFHKNESYADASFDILSGTRLERVIKNDKISKEYVESLIARLEIKPIKVVRSYVDLMVAHSDFKKPELYPSMALIKECHEAIVGVFKEVSLNFFLTDTHFGEASLHKERVLINADKPFLNFT
jgi:hypothetical protein